ncbi:hypothetical protein MKZ38_004613 [Zalerion maritima]|uniref:Dienelactone hydrolase domain-containing protein n=1 Tax=Zalerion maritima TaxID=339359 RepID=A0AAD5RS39_9PEZI|nr:hypothetical protein MKZ38_004613 [Zalerion maritima]
MSHQLTPPTAAIRRLSTLVGNKTFSSPTPSTIVPVAASSYHTSTNLLQTHKRLPSLPFSSSTANAKSHIESLRSNVAKMSTMPATHGHSEACCNIPPVTSSNDYPMKGQYDEFDGLKTYVTGPDDATKGIIVIFDIFGYFPQTIQGADILSTSDKTKYKVVMPDWFEDTPLTTFWHDASVFGMGVEIGGDGGPDSVYSHVLCRTRFPPTTKEHQEKLGAFFQKHGPSTVKPKLPGIMKAVEAKYPSVQSWGILGFCWGGKVVSVTVSAGDNPFKIAAECHPAMVDPADAEGIKVPLCMLASKDEDPEAVSKFESNLSVTKHVETFGDQIHGWMAARSDLEDPRVKEEYVRGYKTVLEFFGKNWGQSPASRL